jgi:hypothetical protein
MHAILQVFSQWFAPAFQNKTDKTQTHREAKALSVGKQINKYKIIWFHQASMTVQILRKQKLLVVSGLR